MPPSWNNNVRPFLDETSRLAAVDQTTLPPPSPTRRELHYQLDIIRANRGFNVEVTYITNSISELRNRLCKDEVVVWHQAMLGNVP